MKTGPKPQTSRLYVHVCSCKGFPSNFNLQPSATVDWFMLDRVWAVPHWPQVYLSPYAWKFQTLDESIYSHFESGRLRCCSHSPFNFVLQLPSDTGASLTERSWSVYSLGKLYPTLCLYCEMITLTFLTFKQPMALPVFYSTASLVWGKFCCYGFLLSQSASQKHKQWSHGSKFDAVSVSRF